MTESLLPPWDSEGEIQHPISAKARRLADLLFADICGGTYSFGTKLPSERVLSENQGLPRSVVRQALGLLENFNVIRRQAGSSSVVCFRRNQAKAVPAAAPSQSTEVTPSEIGKITSPLELVVVRSIVEPEIARLAVLNMTARDIEAIRSIQDEIEAVKVDGEKFAALDDSFRMRLATGTHNPLLVAIYSMINQVSRDASWSVQRRWRLSPARIREYKLQNRSLCEAIEERDIEKAVEYVRLMLADSHQELMPGS